MIVKSDRYNLIGVLMLLGSVACFLFMMYVWTYSVLVALLCGVPLLLLVGLYWLSTGRTLIFNEDGCTIRFLCFKKLHRWEALEEKAVADYKDNSMHTIPYHGGVVFSARKSSRERSSHPIYFSAFRPFSSFYVFFHADHVPSTQSYVKLYTVDENLFREKMNHWGIILDGEGAVERATAA